MKEIQNISYQGDIKTLLDTYYNKYKYSLIHEILSRMRDVGTILVILEMPIEIRNWEDTENCYVYKISQKIKVKIINFDDQRRDRYRDFWKVMYDEHRINPDHIRLVCDDKKEFRRYLKLLDPEERNDQH